MNCELEIRSLDEKKFRLIARWVDIKKHLDVIVNIDPGKVSLKTLFEIAEHARADAEKGGKLK
jgi:hypothetical protein